MRRQPVVADQVFRYNAMDKTLRDYIDRVQKQNNKDNKPTPKDETYPVIPEQKQEEDVNKNPYGQH